MSVPAGYRSAQSVSLVFPAFNEQGYVERAVTRAVAALERVCDDFEIIVVDDGSTDGTHAECARVARRQPRLHFIRCDVHRTLGATLRTGFREARKDVVVYCDIDLPIDMQEIGRALYLLEYLEADVVCAFRHDRSAEGARRAAYSLAYNMLVRAAFGVRVRDVNFGFKVVRRHVLGSLDLASDGSFIDAELVAKSIHSGYRLVQMGVDYFPRSRGESTLDSPAVIAKILRELVTLYPQTRWPPRVVARAPPADVAETVAIGPERPHAG